METGQDNETMPLKDGFNYTPIHRGARVRMRISKTDWESVQDRGLGPRGVITDLDTDKRYESHGLSCGLPRCMCDAEIKELVQ